MRRFHLLVSKKLPQEKRRLTLMKLYDSGWNLDAEFMV